MIEFIGLLGGLFFAYAGVPSAWKTFKNKRSIGVPINLAWSITLGAILFYTYLLQNNGFDLITTINYTIEVISWVVIIYYHYLPRKVKND